MKWVDRVCAGIVYFSVVLMLVGFGCGVGALVKKLFGWEL